MIIELFGPPAVGKTTFACALAERLRERGHIVELVSSYRDTESSRVNGSPLAAPLSSPAAGAVRRVARPVMEMLQAAGYLLGNSRDLATTADLMRTLPPKGIIWSIRLRQYWLRLLRSWHYASRASHIVLFDQGVIQAVSSLVLLGRATDRWLIAQALAATPAADLLIRLDAPRHILEARLRERLQNKVEQLFGLNLEVNLRSVAILEEVDSILRDQHRPVAWIDCTDKRSLGEAVERIENEVAMRLDVATGGR